ncbi:MAG: HhH-GPD family protein [Minisyncoccota bacterium]
MNKREKEFVRKVRQFYKENQRSLPWRDTTDPYRILVSEIMLQQTQVARVEKKYPEFLHSFPTIQALAKAQTREVLRVWQGMGYNRRALALKKAAAVIVNEHKGNVPNTPLLLEKLPGIGPYTARAICTFAFNQPEVFIETNIRRVYLHHFFPRSKNIPDKKLLPLIQATLDKKNPRAWYWALMDYGSSRVKHIPNPNHKSKHYVRQSKFKGSNREVRGKILKLLIHYQTITETKLRKLIQGDNLIQNLVALEHEEFIQKHGKTYTIKN